MSKPNLLFLCTGNSCRSQMGEGWAKQLVGDRFNVYSAGVEQHGLNPNAVAVMAEAGIDITGQESQKVTDLDVEFDYVITVCDHAAQTCPAWPAKVQVIHHEFDDPPRLAKEAKSEEEALDIYRRVRDQIRDYVKTLPELLG